MRVLEHLPRFEVTADDAFIEEDKHGLLATFLMTSHEAPEACCAHVIPHFEPLLYQAASLLVVHEAVFRARFRRRRRRQSMVVDSAVVVGDDVGLVAIDRLHTRHKRVLAGQVPLTKENSLQCLAEEPLTLSRDGVCSPPSAHLGQAPGLVAAVRVIGGEGGT